MILFCRQMQDRNGIKAVTGGDQIKRACPKAENICTCVSDILLQFMSRKRNNKLVAFARFEVPEIISS